jgi:hypothetical protein
MTAGTLFYRFAPSLRVVRLHSGDQNERELMRTELVHRDHHLHSISASFTYDGGHFFS